MQYDICNKERNYNLIGLALSLNELWKKYYKLKKTDVEKSNKYIESYKPSRLENNLLLGPEGSRKLCSDIFNNSEANENRPIFFYKEKDSQGVEVTRVNESYKKCILPFRKEEVVYLKYISRDGVFSYFLSEEDEKKLIRQIDEYLAEQNVSEEEVDKLNEFIIFKGKSVLKDTIEKSKRDAVRKNFTLISRAINDSKELSIDYFWNGEHIKETIIPIDLVYSQLEERFRVLAYIKEMNKFERLYLSEMSNVEEGAFVKESDLPALPKTVGLVVRIENGSNSLERFASRVLEYPHWMISDFEANDSSYKWLYCLFLFPENDTGRVRNRILSLGKHVKVISDKQIVRKIVSTVRKKDQTLEEFGIRNSDICNLGEKFIKYIVGEMKKGLE